METITSIKPLLAVLVSLLAVIPIVMSGSKPNLRETWTFLAGIIKFGLVVSMLPLVLNVELEPLLSNDTDCEAKPVGDIDQIFIFNCSACYLCF